MSKSKRTLVIVAAALALGIGYWVWGRDKETGPDYRPVTVEKGDLEVNVQSTGTVQPENRVDIKPPIPGRAERVLVKEGDRVRKGQTLVLMSSTERAALLDAASARGPEEFERWSEIYRATPVLAPIGGTIISRAIEPGQTFVSTDSILAMSDRLSVIAQVDETDLAEVRVGQMAEVVLDAYPELRITSRVSEIAYEAKTVNNVTTYAVTVVPEQVPEYMRSGMTANVTFKVAERKNVLVVPNEAIKVRDGKRYVLVAEDGGERSGKRSEPREVPIETGLTDGKKSELLAGLQEGDVALVTVSKALAAKPAGTNPFNPMSGMRGGQRSGSQGGAGGGGAPGGAGSRNGAR